MHKLIIAIISFLACMTLSTQAISQTKLSAEVPQEFNTIINKTGFIYLELSVVPGGIYGTPTKSPIWFIDLSKQLNPSIDIKRLESELPEYATDSNSGMSSRKILITPSETKLVRLGTAGYVVNNEKGLMGAFLNQSKKPVMLVYFDRACKVSGDVTWEDGEVYSHNFQIPEAGLYELELIGGKTHKTFLVGKPSNSLIVELRNNF
jgi:hypothetical protein